MFYQFQGTKHCEGNATSAQNPTHHCPKSIIKKNVFWKHFFACSKQLVHLLNPFLANVPNLYPLKTPNNQRFSCVFRGYKMETLARNRLKIGISMQRYTNQTQLPEAITQKCPGISPRRSSFSSIVACQRFIKARKMHLLNM